MRRTGIFAAAAGLLLCSSGAQAACDKMDPVTAVWLPIMQTTAYYVALEEKLFEKACIEIVSTKMESPNQIIDALIAERADFGPPGAAAGIAMIAESGRRLFANIAATTSHGCIMILFKCRGSKRHQTGSRHPEYFAD